MKILLTISAIILLSFESNHLKVNYTDSSIVSEGKLLSSTYITKENLPFIDSTVYRSPRSIKKENVVTKATVVTSKKVSNTSRKAAIVEGSKKMRVNYSALTNTNNMMLHRLIKESGSFKAFTIVQFDFNKHNSLGTKEFNTMLQYADQLIFDRSLKVSVAGFSDNVGTVEANEHISWLRANNVKAYLLELGVDEEQIVVSANGINDPVAGNATEFGRLMNRRVEMALIQL